MSENRVDNAEVYKPYKTWKSPLNVLRYGYYGRWTNPYGLWNNIKQFFRNLKYAKQRIIRGYCDWDIWNLDYFYLEMFYSTLMRLKEITHSYPGRGDMDTEEKWDKFLEEMAIHFRKANDEYQDEYYPNEYDFSKPSENEAYVKSMYDIDAYQTYELLSGLSMMKSHFKDLWD